MTVRVLGIDPGLTRFGYGIIDISPQGKPGYVASGVLKSSADDEVPHRVNEIADGFRELLQKFSPDRIAIERIFAQQNLHSVMSVAFISGVVFDEAVSQNMEINSYTPTQVKAQVTGYGKAEKQQVANMVTRLLTLKNFSVIADESDALALALCDFMLHKRVPVSGTTSVSSQHAQPGVQTLTPAQKLWLEAERRHKK